MKTSTYPVLAAVAALTVACSPALLAQVTSGPDQNQNARANDSSDANQSTASGTTTTGNRNDSKDGASQTMDPNAGTARTDSAVQSTSKTPSDATTSNVAQTQANEVPSASNDGEEKPLSDKEFVMKAAQGGMTEVELGKVASDQGASAQVKEFGARMVKDHGQANDELKSIARQKGIMISPQLDARHQAQVDKLSKLSGSAFDKAYVKNQVHAHEMTVALFKQEVQSGQDPELKAFASKTLPTLEDHCSSITTIQKDGSK